MVAITNDIFLKIFPKCKDSVAIVKFINDNAEKYGIVSIKNYIMFLTQCGYESAGFTVRKESYNYSAERLLVVFPKYFNTTNCKDYANSSKIFDRAYANRMGNGNEATKDGSLYCGRGYIQLTGKSNYIEFATYIGKSLVDTVKHLETPQGAIESALWFCKVNGVFLRDDIKMCTKIITGGGNGLAGRIELHKTISKLLQP